MKRNLVFASLLLTLVLSVWLAWPPPTRAQCAPGPRVEGEWRNIAPDWQYHSSLTVEFFCGDHITCPLGGQCDRPYTGYEAHFMSPCDNCQWGGRPTVYKTFSDQVVLYYRFNNADVYAWLVPYVGDAGQPMLQVVFKADFIDPAQHDIEQTEYFEFVSSR